MLEWQQRNNRMSSRYRQQREELEQAYYEARAAKHRSGLTVAQKQKWRELEERAAESLRLMGFFGHYGGPL